MVATLGALLVFAAASPLNAAPKGHKAPAESLAVSPGPEPDSRQKVLSEMWRRGILDPEAVSWSPKDMTLLERIRWAEEWGALKVLERGGGNLKGLVFEEGGGTSRKALRRITRKGFERYLQVKTERARKYFEKKGVDAKWVFELKDIKGRALFDEGGVLSEWGDVLYTRASIGKPAFWKTPWGEVMGNRPPRAIDGKPVNGKP